MILVYLIALIMLALLYFATIKYKKKYKGKEYRKNYKFQKIWSMAMFLMDLLPKRWISKQGKIDRYIKAVSVKENIQEDKYLYMAEKVSVSIVLVALGLIIAILVGVGENGSHKQISTLNREQAYYQLEVEGLDEQKEEVNIEIPKRKLTGEEKKCCVDEAKESLEKEFLGKNQDFNQIYYNINLIDSIGENSVSVMWDISDSTVIDYQGHIQKNVSKDGIDIKVTATLVLDDYIDKIEYNLKVFPSKEKQDLQSYLENYVREENINEEQIDLPKTFNGTEIRFYLSSQQYSGWAALVGLIVGFIVFFLKDKDLDKELKERNQQLINDYPEVVSKILLFYGTGLSIRQAFDEIVKEYKKQSGVKRYVYEEMEFALNKMKSGVSEGRAINEFGNRCGVHCYIKMSGIIEQNIKRGTKEIIYILKDELNKAMSEKKNRALKVGSEISTKLLGPMVIMLVVTIAIVMVPAIMSINL